MAEETVGTMGQAGEINITSDMMTKAKDAISKYKSAIEDAYDKLDKTIDGIQNDFTGAAATGFNTFYTEQIKSMLEKEKGTIYTLLSVLDSICQSALEQLPGESGVDNELAKINNPNNGQTATPTN